MHIPAMLQSRFASALASLTDQPEKYAALIRPTTDPRFGDYQSNCAMPLAKQAGKDTSAVDVANKIVDQLQVDDLCQPPQIADRGFINLTMKDSTLQDCITRMLSDARCLVPPTTDPKRIVIDYSSPNVAKPMHVGHIRSTVIGDCLARILRFLGHHVVTDNHLGDWGTQFGMIIFGYKHFGDPAVIEKDPVPELTSLYRMVNQLIEYPKLLQTIPQIEETIQQSSEEREAVEQDAAKAEGKQAKKLGKLVKNLAKRISGAKQRLEDTREKIAAVESNPKMREAAERFPEIETAVLAETAKLHEDDEENLALWKKFLPHCNDEINRIYHRLNIKFDHTLGESFYHPMLAGVVSDLQQRGLAVESDGAICVFLPDFDAPMIIRKQDGAFLYSTTDLATLQYRLQEFEPDEILYVVDTRQSEHFQKLFDVARQIGMDDIKLVHVNFGTVLGKDGKPLKTKSGDLIGLEGLLNDAVESAREVVCDPARLASLDPPMDEAEQCRVAEAVGIGAVKYADLAHHRTSDYKFDAEKMVAKDGNTATYVQYAYVRTQGIMRKAGVDDAGINELIQKHPVVFTHPAERALALSLLRLEEALLAAYDEFAPNLVVDYVYDAARTYTTFNQECPVLKAETEAIRSTRLALVTLSGRVLKLGLQLLGIQAVERM